MNLEQIRESYPQYKDIPDNDLVTRLHETHYADKMSFEDFAGRIGYEMPDPMMSGEINRDPTEHQNFVGDLETDRAQVDRPMLSRVEEKLAQPERAEVTPLVRDKPMTLLTEKLPGALKKVLIENLPERLKMHTGGVMQAAGATSAERTAGAATETQESGRSWSDNLKTVFGLSQEVLPGIIEQTAEKDSPYFQLKGWMKAKGRALFQEGQQAVEANQPQDLNKMEQFFVDSARAVEDMIPAITAGYLTKSPGPALAILGGQVYGDTYGDSIEQGLDPYQANARAQFHTLAEIVPETIPMFAILRRGTPGVKRFLEASLGEGAQEMITSVMQQSYDSQELEGMTLKQALLNIDWGQVGYEGLVGLATGTTLYTGTRAIEKAVGKPSEVTEEIITDVPRETAPIEPVEAKVPVVAAEAISSSKIDKNTEKKVYDFKKLGDPVPLNDYNDPGEMVLSDGVVVDVVDINAEQPEIPAKPKLDTTLYANPVQAIYKGYQEMADQVFNYADEKIGRKFSPLGNLPEQNEYLKTRYRTLGKIGETDTIIDEIYSTFSKAKDPQQIYKYLTTKDASPSIISDPVVRKKAVATKRLIDRIGQGLVKRRLLSKETYEKHKGAYLPRIYLKHLLDEKAFRALGTGKKPSDMGYLKQRKDIPKEIREVILGEIEDPAFLASKGVGRSLRDVALIDFMDQVATNKDWAHPDYIIESNGRRVSVYWLKNEADRLREQSKHQAPEVREKALAVATRMEDLANEKLQGAEENLEDWRQMPDTPRYGMLRGMYVRKEIYDDIVGIGQLEPNNASFFEKLLGYGGYGTKATQLWKMSKVALNPPTQVRNFVSNGILLHLSGVPFVRVPDRVISAIQQIRKNGKYWRIAKKYGIQSSTFSANELFKIEKQLLDLKAKQKGTFSLAQLNRMAGVITETAGDIYQFSEGIFKTAKIMDAMENGMGEADAVLEANKWLYDYSLIPRGVRYLRNAPIGIPFITFYYKTLPRMLEVAIKHPARFAPYVAMPMALSAAIAALYDVDDDDVKKLKKTMPRWLQDKGTSYLLPYKDKHGRWQAINLEYYLPWAMYTEFLKESLQGNFGKAVKTTGILGGPIPDMIGAIKTNTDPFTGREIVREEDPPAEQVYSLFNYVWGLSMPSWLGQHGFVSKMRKAITDEVNPRTGDLPLTEGQAALNFFGLNIYPYEPEEQRRRNISWMQYEIKEQRKRLRTKLRDKTLTNEDKVNIRKVYNELIKQKQADLKDYQSITKIHPNLKAVK